LVAGAVALLKETRAEVHVEILGVVRAADLVATRAATPVAAEAAVAEATEVRGDQPSEPANRCRPMARAKTDRPRW
jgi:hypothetical protein